ncbi:TRAP transporter substrate-binding protein [Serinibacter salmoneus]|uniref:Tripartite ATP-independent transporter DctP family solute receptor n=1 Tax=Serinibacter salmoneus TaxID=556530 RepID=A0A2A9D318_9MICO|nr:TRAP transporter substrate-binding protein [Serinibacter salmoneus]PFG20645.1 tripartite ATP-independent transporter DctP family solute receptor [Serinibacter salmoneus]
MKRTILTVAAAAATTLTLAACGGGFESPADSGDTADTESEAADSGSVSAADAETVYRVAFNQNDQHPQFVSITNLGQRIAEATDGMCSLEVYPNETLGTQKDTIELVQAGTLDFAIIAGPLLENFNTDFAVFNLPYTFDSQEHQRAVLDDPEITGELFASIEDQNIAVLAGMHGGIRNVYNSIQPVNTPEDLDGMKIRVIESDTNLRMMELMGGSGSPMGQGEVYTAIQSGVIDGGENNPSIFANLKHDEVAPYYSYTQHLMFPDYLISNPSVLEDMDPACNEALFAELPAALVEEGQLWVEEVEASTAAAEEAGAEFNEVDLEAFREAVAPLVEESLTNETTQELYDKVRAAAE